MNGMIDVLKTVSPFEWGFWAVVIVAGIKGFIEYPYCIEKNIKKYEKLLPKDSCMSQ